ncbi:hypothetical protein [Flavivirga algicola]|uniref:Uncharacterized protein n=1 Tax=Flavivirga algicola TaxID=2729136 RepID=A0ABX1S561_9FLAO|nr:hypothetical protein [Flavivirga algicola]NMH89569.1 hypothetical protein [Flavivirga algicola]
MAKKTKINVFASKKVKDVFKLTETDLHFYDRTKLCTTDDKGYATPKGLDPAEIVLEVSKGLFLSGLKRI